MDGLRMKPWFPLAKFFLTSQLAKQKFPSTKATDKSSRLANDHRDEFS